MATGKAYDVIVVGVGGMGAAACYHLAQRGQRVLGLERFDVPHGMGSSHGVNRIIRLAYYEDPSYVPLLRRSYELWRELERGFGEHLLHITGSIDAGEAEGEVFTGSLQSCALHGLPYEVYSGAELAARYPGYRLPGHYAALYQPEGGFVMSERAVVAHVSAALALGAEIRGRERVLGWEVSGAGVRVRTDRGEYEAGQLVVSAGAWAGKLVPALAPFAVPERQVLGWFQPVRPELFDPSSFPVFNLTVEEGRYYGFPVFGIPGFKVGRYHHRGEQIDPESWEREPDAGDETLLRTFVKRYFPEAAGPVLTLRSCIFTNTPDEHFLIDRLPGEERVIVASPCSGHGYKFCPVVGEIVADLVVDGRTRHDIARFRAGRFGLGTEVATG